MKTKLDYVGNLALSDVTKPYLLLERSLEPATPAGSEGYEWKNVYQFSTKEGLAEAMKVIEGIPVKTLEARIKHTVEIMGD